MAGLLVGTSQHKVQFFTLEDVKGEIQMYIYLFILFKKIFCSRDRLLRALVLVVATVVTKNIFIFNFYFYCAL